MMLPLARPGAAERLETRGDRGDCFPKDGSLILLRRIRRRLRRLRLLRRDVLHVGRLLRLLLPGTLA
jgi:hypothetical protein